MLKTITEARLELDKLTKDYFSHLVKEFWPAIDADRPTQGRLDYGDDQEEYDKLILKAAEEILEKLNAASSIKDIQELFSSKEYKYLKNVSYFHLTNLLNKLEAVAELRNIITQPCDDQDEIKQREILGEFHQCLQNKNDTLTQHRYLFSDIFANLCSAILFPIMIGRAVSSRITHGTWNLHFFRSQGGVMAHKAEDCLASVRSSDELSTSLN